ncbi:XdhC family protein [Luedemannella flava]|uniref:XdhC family protein n=1 Tax=Luedemannella flava TaxID=349316 RepID=UPI0031E2ABA7
MNQTDVLARADGLRNQRTPFVLATVVRARRPTSAKAGDRAIVLADGTIEGFVGGVCAETTVRAQGLALLGSGESTLLRITPTDDAVETAVSDSDGLVVVANPCLSGGTLDIFLEPVLPAALLHVHGDAPIAAALVDLARAAGYAVTTDGEVADDATGVVVAAHGRDEERVLVEALLAGVPYVALVASPKRGSAVVADLPVPAAQRARVKTPAGLDLGARTPMEVAVTILAELVAARAGKLPHLTTVPASGGGLLTMAAPVAPPAVAIDPICHMEVAAVPSSLHSEYDGTTYYFCAPGCRKRFEADPQRYVA